jgi:hypothetical protein
LGLGYFVLLRYIYVSPWQVASGGVLIIIQARYLPMLTVLRIACCLVLDFNANYFIGLNKIRVIQLRCILNQFR